MKTKIKVKCNQCGNEWFANPQHLLRGHRCRKCALKQRDCNKNIRKTTEQFVEEMKNKNPNIQIIGEYINAKTKIMCKCSICNYEWESKPANLLSGYGCPDCGNKSTRSKQIWDTESFADKLRLINPKVKIVGEYNGYRNAVRCQCLQCGQQWDATPSNLLKGTGCPLCKASHGEKYIIEQLIRRKISFVFQKRFSELVGLGGRTLPYDFYLPTYNTLIEYQGRFHDNSDRLQTESEYEKLTTHDKLKKHFAEANGFRLIEIWYYDNIDEKLNKIINITNPVTTTAS